MLAFLVPVNIAFPPRTPGAFPTTEVLNLPMTVLVNDTRGGRGLVGERTDGIDFVDVETRLINGPLPPCLLREAAVAGHPRPEGTVFEGLNRTGGWLARLL